MAKNPITPCEDCQRLPCICMAPGSRIHGEQLAQALADFRDSGGSALEVVEKLEAFINAKVARMSLV